jgi:hypothetical protein
MGYLFGIVFVLAVAIFAYLIGGTGAIIPAMTLAAIGLGALMVVWMVTMYRTRERASDRMLRHLREHPLQFSDETAVDPILDEPVAAMSAELVDLIRERVSQWKVWHPHG